MTKTSSQDLIKKMGKNRENREKSNKDFFDAEMFIKTFGSKATTVLGTERFYSFEEIYKMVVMPDDLEKYLDETMNSGKTDESEKYYLLFQDMIKVYLIYVEIYHSTYGNNEDAFLRRK